MDDPPRSRDSGPGPDHSPMGPGTACTGRPLTEFALREQARRLADSDPDLAAVLDRFGSPPLWDREPGFATLVHLILEQQVSLASARAAMDRLVDRIGTPTPAALLALGDDHLLQIGFSRQKRRYARGLATRILEGSLSLEALAGLPDPEVRERLTAARGIGAWTADIYLLMALRRPDVWPVGDRALVVAARRLRRLPEDPSPDRMQEIGEAWRPWRSVAARMLWHLYLSDIRPPGGRGN